MIGKEAIARLLQIAFFSLVFASATEFAFAQENFRTQTEQQFGSLPLLAQSTTTTTTTTTNVPHPVPSPTPVLASPPTEAVSAPEEYVTPQTSLPPPGTPLSGPPVVTSTKAAPVSPKDEARSPSLTDGERVPGTASPDVRLNPTNIPTQQPVLSAPTVVRAPSKEQPQQMNVDEFEKWFQTKRNHVNAKKPVMGEYPEVQMQVPEKVVTKVMTHKTYPKKHLRSGLGGPLTFLENQQVMLNQAPPSRIPPVADSDIAFNTMLQQNMPLTPRQVVRLRQQIDVSQRAAAILPNIPPKPVSTTLMVNLAPGTTPPAIRLAQGYISSLVFVDSTGSPWPIAAFDIGNPKAVNLQWDGKSNILMMQAVTPYSNGDIVIRLVGLPTPITFELVSGQRVVDYRIDIHVPGIGPNTKELPSGTTLPGGANQLLLGVLDGVAPAGSHGLLVRGADAQAWILGDRIYLRTRFTVLSPGWTGTMVSPDGMHAYELPRTSSILISRYGTPAELRVEGF